MSFKSIVLVTVALVSFNSFAGLQAIKGSNGKITITDAAYDSVINGNSPACVKDGGSVIGVNEAFNTAKLKSRDCSNGDAAAAKHEALGLKVTVFKLAELSLAKRKEILNRK
jgi:hypothetical protein